MHTEATSDSQIARSDALSVQVQIWLHSSNKEILPRNTPTDESLSYSGILSAAVFPYFPLPAPGPDSSF